MTTQKIRVLLVEDDLPYSRFLQEVLRDRTHPTFEVHVARTLADGKQMMKELAPDVVLLDLGLPDSDGLATLEQVDRRVAPVVVLTGRDDDRLAMEAMERGAQDLLVKDQMTPSQLARAVRFAIQRHRQRLQQQETERALAAKDLVLDELNDLNEMKSRFIEVVTHEMRTPMTAVLCAVDLLLDGSLGAMSGAQKKYLELVARNIDRLARFSTEVLRLARLDADRYELRPVETSLSDTLTPVVDLLTHTSQQKQITLELLGATTDDEVEVFADPDGVSQVITNLVSNANNHCPAGTTVRISWANVDGGLVEITVADDGPGIPADRLDKVFDRFYQADHKSGTGYKGTGIGLSVCHGLVEKMGGRITVDSGPGQGSTFRFTLPSVEESDEFLFGKLAVKMGYISSDELRRVADEQYRLSDERHLRLGELLLKKKMLSKIKLEHILGYQDALLSRPHPSRNAAVGESLLGRLAVDQGLLSKKEMESCVWIQELRRADGQDARLGQVMVEKGFLNEQDIVRLLDLQEQIAVS